MDHYLTRVDLTEYLEKLKFELEQEGSKCFVNFARLEKGKTVSTKITLLEI